MPIDDASSTPTPTSDSCLQCGADLLDRGGFLECQRCGNLEYD
jgi:transposase